MKLRKLNRKGISIIELILVLAIAGIVFQMVYSILFVGSKSFVKGKDMGFAQQDGRILSDAITKELRVAKTIEVENIPAGKYHFLKVMNGDLIKTSVDGGNKETVLFSGSIENLVFERKSEDGQGVLRCILTLKEGKEVYTSEFNVLLENLPAYNAEFENMKTIYYTTYE